MPEMSAESYMMGCPVMVAFRKSQSAYISLHNQLFAPGANPTDFKRLNQEAHKVVLGAADILESWVTQVRLISSEVDVLSQETFGPVVQLGNEYFDVYNQLTIKLFKIINRLYEKSQNPDAYSLQLYQSDVAEYHALDDKYREKGKNLNNEFARLRLMNIHVQPDVVRKRAGQGCMVLLVTTITLLILVMMAII